eukprot:TRINITY_DN42_c6_g1_i1.p1 TRINITY_DN42_c6_g1~~TRINITY_DN42_c6_g1_i1.p1  ORF type:complete len:260 (+),score=55.29 TRINITY_DN42_c6_g1_i1:42-821(+)
MDDLRAKGNDFFKKKMYQEAIDQYSKAIDLCEPNSENVGTISSNKAACYIQLKNYDSAIEAADICIRCRPEWVKGYFRKAGALLAKGNLDDAEKNYSLALKYEPTNTDIGDSLTDVRAKIKERNTKTTPASCKTAKDAKLIGNSLFGSGSYEEAITYYTRAVELSEGTDDPDRATYFVNRATCHAQTSSYGQVICDCGNALEINPNNAKAFLRRAMAYEGLGKWQKALDDYNAVISRGQSNPQVAAGAARCRKNVNDTY